MKRFRRILIVYNRHSDNKASFRQALWLAEHNNLTITIAEVLENVPHYIEDLAIKERKKVLKKQFQVPSHIQKPTIKIFSGTPFIEIIREVIEGKHDLVMMEPIKPIGYLTRIFCSLSMHLIRKCPCPVWIMRPENITDQNFRILAAIDAKADDSSTDELNHSIMSMSTFLADSGHCQLHVAHAWKHPWEEALKTGPELTRNEKLNAMNEIRKQRKEYLNNLCNQYQSDSFKMDIHLEKGEAIYVIPKVVATKEINLIVMGTVCRTAIMGLIMGNTCEDILQQVNCSVLALKPENFIYDFD